MVIALKEDVEQFIEEQVRAGHFGSVAELVETAVARLMVDGPDDELTAGDIAAIRESDDQFARGEFRKFSEVAAELRAKYLNR